MKKARVCIIIFFAAGLSIFFGSCVSSQSGTVVPQSTELFVLVDDLSVRTQPLLDAEVIRTLPAGTRLQPTGTVSRHSTRVSLRGRALDAPWFEVRLPDEKTGWVFSGALADKYPPDQGQFVAMTGFRDYVYAPEKGGLKMPSGYSCDGTSDPVADLLRCRGEKDYVFVNRRGETALRIPQRSPGMPSNLHFAIGDFHEGLALVRVDGVAMSSSLTNEIKKAGFHSVGFIDAKGKRVIEIPGRYNSTGFRGGFAVMNVDAIDLAQDHVLIVNRKGQIKKIQIQRGSTTPSHFSEGVIPVVDPVDENRTNYINTDGGVEFSIRGRPAGGFSEGLAAYWESPDRNTKYFIDRTGKKVSLIARGGGDLEFSAGRVLDCRVPLKADRYGGYFCPTNLSLLDRKGGRISVPAGIMTTCDDMGLFAFTDPTTKKMGYASCRDGSTVIKPAFEHAFPFTTNVAWVALKTTPDWTVMELGLIDARGNLLWSSKP